MNDVKLNAISRDIVESAESYQQYRDGIDLLLSQNRTTGENQSEAMIHYTNMNVHRMKRLDKKIELNDTLNSKLLGIERDLTWLVLTEAWCGDAAQLVPLFSKMAEVSDKVKLRLILRDEHLEIMDQFLTNGRSRSIPKLICLDADTLNVLGDWGPRPAAAQLLFNAVRNMPDVPYQKASERLHKWYADDKTESTQKEFLPLMTGWGKRD